MQDLRKPVVVFQFYLLKMAETSIKNSFALLENHVPENTEVDEDGGFRIGISGAGNDYMAWLSAGNDGGEFVITVRSWQKQGVPEVTRDILLLVAGNEDGMEI